MMKSCKVGYQGVLVVILAFILGSVFLSCTAAQKEVIKSKGVAYNVCPSAKITKVEYFIKKYKGAPRLHFTIAIKNVSKEPKRFRVQIFLPEGPSAGGFYPRKGKPPVMKPGEELSRTFPMYFSTIPSGFTIVVKEL